MPITPQEALQRTIEHREIFHDEMVELMRQIMRGAVSPAMTAAILTGLRVKKETVGETSPRMIARIRSTISSWKISRCSIVRCNASCGVMGIVNVPGSCAAARGRVR